jgi:DNA-binding MarR family transcriptional regulator
VSDRNIGRELKKLSNKIHREIDKFASKSELTGAEGRVLHYILGQEDDVYQRDIEVKLGLRSSTATEILKKMELDELIIRKPAKNDGRLKKIIVTEKALKYKDIVVNDLKNFEKKLKTGLSEEEIDIFLKVVEKMINNLS